MFICLVDSLQPDVDNVPLQDKALDNGLEKITADV